MSDDWFEDRQTLNRFSEPEVDGESIWLISYADMMTLLFGFFVLLSSFSKIDVDTFEGIRRETTQYFGGEYKKVHEQLAAKLKEEMNEKGMSENAIFEDLGKGVAITFRGSLFFDPGSADLRAEAKDVILNVIESIKQQGQVYNIMVEGHTDDNPISNEKFPSNWELSSQRAAAVLRVFERSGFDRARLRAVGFSDTLPVLPNRTPAGKVLPENQTQNRRVVIKLLRPSKTVN